MADILQGKIAGKAKLDTTETQTKIVEQRKNRTYTPLRVDPQAVTIPAALKPQTKWKAKAITTTTPHQTPYAENEYSPPRVETEPVMPVPQPVQKLPTRHKKELNKLYKDVGLALIVSHSQKTPKETT